MTQTPDRPRGVHTKRDAAKAERRAAILVAAARLMAERGFANVRLEDIGSAVGVSGPAMYRHFAAKHDLLAEMLRDVSQRLLDGGTAALRQNPGDPAGALRRLIAFHVEFAVTEPDLIQVHYRDLSSLDAVSEHRVRRLQGEYVGLWVEVLCRLLDIPVEVAPDRGRM